MKQHHGIWLPDCDNDWLEKYVETDGSIAYQGDRLASALTHCAHRRVAIDAGAHVGLWTHQLARHFNYVFAFEPVPANAECWLMNCSGLKGRTDLIQSGLGAASGVMTIRRPSRSNSWTLAERDAPTAVERVFVTTLDSAMLTGVRVDLIKIDVEGWEYEVLQGAQKTIARCRPVIVIEEKHDPHRRASAWLSRNEYLAVAKHKNDFVWRPK